MRLLLLMLLLLLLLLQGLQRGVVSAELGKQCCAAAILVLSVPQPLKRLNNNRVSGSMRQRQHASTAALAAASMRARAACHLARATALRCCSCLSRRIILSMTRSLLLGLVA